MSTAEARRSLATGGVPGTRGVGVEWAGCAILYNQTLITGEDVIARYGLQTWDVVAPDARQNLVRLPTGVGVAPTLEKVAFLTTDRHLDGMVAANYLATTYSPSCCTMLSREGGDILIDNLGYPVTDDQVEARSRLSRVWPAFGHHGGSHELLLKKGQLKRTASHWLVRGGLFDEYRQNNTDIYDPDSLMSIASIIWSNVNTIPEQKKEGASGKIAEAGLVIHWFGAGGEYSISVAVDQRPTEMRLMFWGYRWIDDEDGLSRWFTRPLATECSYEGDFPQMPTFAIRTADHRTREWRLVTSCTSWIAAGLVGGRSETRPENWVALP
jgi:hypothetical protein